MKIGPRYKIAKRLGAAVFEKTQTQKFSVSESRTKANKKKKRPANLSEYGRQFLEKQKLRFTYGITEKQLKKYASFASEKSNPSAALFSALEMRADNAVSRAGFARSRRMARQLVSHGHITVNGTRITVPSYALSVGDVIAVRQGSFDSSLFANITPQGAPAWLQVDAAKKTAKVVAEPTHNKGEMHADIASVFEFYSR
jgi:small subunit ribosomal protein S4